MTNYDEMAVRVFARRDGYISRKKRRAKIGAAGMGCAALAVTVGFGLWHGELPERADVASEKHMAVTERDGFTVRGEIADLSRQIGQETPEVTFPPKNDPPYTGEGAVISDPEFSGEPVQGDYSGNLKSIGDAWGGCYMDKDGSWVIWLTENTEENRQRVFKANPSLSEDNSKFKTADYSYKYLNELMAGISTYMTQGRLPNTTTAALREEINRVVVTLSRENEESEREIMALDVRGGAVEIVIADESPEVRNMVEHIQK